jgi:hypothetical protein
LAKDPAERYATADDFADALAGRETPAAKPAAQAEAGDKAKKGCAAVILLSAALAGMAARLLR